jgi:hypothetical protein
MGKDKQPKHRQQARDLARKESRHAPYARILIVCEGEKTEPLYFGEIQQEYRLNPANVKIVHPKCTTPLQIVEAAIERVKEDKEWDYAYCVFDRDDHPNYDQALQKATANDKKIPMSSGETARLIAIPSSPCFELWLLLHFAYHDSDSHRSLVTDLLDQPDRLPGYTKGQGDHFARTKDRLAEAYKNAETLRSERNRHGSIGVPYTNVDLLVRHLMTLGSTHK